MYENHISFINRFLLHPSHIFILEIMVKISIVQFCRLFNEFFNFYYYVVLKIIIEFEMMIIEF
jgi:hypothetical protein